MRTNLLAVLLLGLFACGGEKKEPVTPTPDTPPAKTSEPGPSASAEAPVTPVPRKQRPLEIYSSCSDVVTVVFSEDPKAPGAGRKTIAPTSSIDGPRDADGNQTIWLLDDKGEPIAKVHVTRGMKR